MGQQNAIFPANTGLGSPALREGVVAAPLSPRWPRGRSLPAPPAPPPTWGEVYTLFLFIFTAQTIHSRKNKGIFLSTQYTISPHCALVTHKLFCKWVRSADQAWGPVWFNWFSNKLQAQFAILLVLQRIIHNYLKLFWFLNDSKNHPPECTKALEAVRNTTDSKHHVLARKNKILSLLNHAPAAFQIYIKSTSLSKKSDIKNWTQVQQNASYLHVGSLNRLGAGLSAFRDGIQIF